MKNIVIAIILSISLIICAAILQNRYKIIMNSGEMSGLVMMKYDTITGRTWCLLLSNRPWQWVEIKDYGRYYLPKNSFIPEEKDNSNWKDVK